MTTNLIVRYDDDFELDEIVATEAYVHLERMSHDWFCLIVEQGSRRLLVNVGCKNRRQKAIATIYADEGTL